MKKCNFISFSKKTKFLVAYFLVALTMFSHHEVLARATSEHTEKPFLSSLPAALIAPSAAFNTKEGSLTLYPERSSLVSEKNRNRIKYNYKIQSNLHAPMIVVIPGIGGLSNSRSVLYLAEMAYNLGYSVITLPSTTHWSFALAASTTGRTGHMSADAKDFYQVLKSIKSKLEEKYQIQPSHWGLMGASYGTLDGSFLLAQDLEEKVFNFQFLIIINPPLNRSLATTKVDGYFAYGDQWPDRKKTSLERFMLQRVLAATQGPNLVDTYQELEQAFPIEENELAWLMGNLFRRVIINSAGIGDLIEKNQSSSSSETLKSFQGTITDYLREKLYKKHYGAQANEDFLKLENESNLSYALSKNNSELLKTKKIILFHSTNDYLSFPEGQEVLNQLSVEKHIYPYGGHLGILGDGTMLKELKAVLTRLKTSN